MHAKSTDSNVVSVFAAQRSHDDALTVVLVNKSTSPVSTPLYFSDIGTTQAERYSYDASNLEQIVQQEDVALRSGSTTLELPSYSITLLEIQPAQQQGIAGDISEDGMVDAVDIDLLFAAIENQSDDDRFDLNNDDELSQSDAEYLVTELLNTSAGDVNLDRRFDSSDLIAVFQAGKYESALGASWAEGDWNGDGKFDTSDLIAAFQSGAYQ